MSNPLVRNPETGFLESPAKRENGLVRNYFNSDRKVQFLAKADEFIAEGKFPPVHLICRAIGISTKTFELHSVNDPVFKAAWEERRAALKSLFTAMLADKANEKNGTLANLAMLRYLESNTWLPETRINHITDNPSAKAELLTISGAIDAEIVPNSPGIPDNSGAPADQGDAHK